MKLVSEAHVVFPCRGGRNVNRMLLKLSRTLGTKDGDVIHNRFTSMLFMFGPPHLERSKVDEGVLKRMPPVTLVEVPGELLAPPGARRLCLEISY